MIWGTAALSIALTSTAHALSYKETLLKHLEARHQFNVQKLGKTLQNSPKNILVGDITRRALLDNAAFLNWAFSSDDSCSSDPYGFAGIGTGSCIPSSDGDSAFMITCDGTQSELNITKWNYDSVDCSGTLQSTQSAVVNGSCQAESDVDDEEALDDVFNNADDFWFPYDGSQQITCDTTRQMNSFFEFSAFNDQNCNVMTRYYGINKNACVYIDSEGYYLKVSGSECKYLMIW